MPRLLPDDTISRGAAAHPPGSVPARPKPPAPKARGGTAPAQGAFNSEHPRTAKGRVGGGQFATKREDQKAKGKAKPLSEREALQRAGVQTIAEFQKTRGLPVTGKSDAATRTALANAVTAAKVDADRAALKGGSKAKGSKAKGAAVKLARGEYAKPGMGSSDHPDARVKKVQEDLERLGYDVARDGVYGPELEKAVRQFQEDSGDVATGIVSEGTLRRMEKRRADRDSGKSKTGHLSADEQVGRRKREAHAPTPVSTAKPKPTARMGRVAKGSESRSTAAASASQSANVSAKASKIGGRREPKTTSVVLEADFAARATERLRQGRVARRLGDPRGFEHIDGGFDADAEGRRHVGLLPALTGLADGRALMWKVRGSSADFLISRRGDEFAVRPIEGGEFERESFAGDADAVTDFVQRVEEGKVQEGHWEDGEWVEPFAIPLGKLGISRAPDWTSYLLLARRRVVNSLGEAYDDSKHPRDDHGRYRSVGGQIQAMYALAGNPAKGMEQRAVVERVENALLDAGHTPPDLLPGHEAAALKDYKEAAFVALNPGYREGLVHSMLPLPDKRAAGAFKAGMRPDAFAAAIRAEQRSGGELMSARTAYQEAINSGNQKRIARTRQALRDLEAQSRSRRSARDARRKGTTMQESRHDAQYAFEWTEGHVVRMLVEGRDEGSARRIAATAARARFGHGFANLIAEGQVLADVEYADLGMELVEAAGSLAKASSPSPLSHSKTSNWVARAGGLPAYIQHIAKALMRERGKSESQAVQMAIGIVKRWARGGGKVDAETRAAAAKAVVEWEALKAKNKAKSAAK